MACTLIDIYEDSPNEYLPYELLLHIFSYTPPKDLLRGVSGTCRTWRQAGRDQFLWKDKCCREGLVPEGETGHIDWIEQYKSCTYAKH